MKNNIEITVNNVVEDEKDANGLWDLAAELALAVAFKRESVTGQDEEQPYYPDEWGQEEVYNILLDLAKYTHPEHYSNRQDDEDEETDTGDLSEETKRGWLEKAKIDYEELLRAVKQTYKDYSLAKMCKALLGHNLDEKEGLFDVNFGCITATVFKNGKDFCLSDSMEVWDDEEGSMISETTIGNLNTIFPNEKRIKPQNICKYCQANETGFDDPDVLCSECRADFGHFLFSEL